MISHLLTHPPDARQRQTALVEARSLPTLALVTLRASLTRDLAAPVSVTMPRAFVAWRVAVVEGELARRAGGGS
jgi:hypothetical protein